MEENKPKLTLFQFLKDMYIKQVERERKIERGDVEAIKEEIKDLETSNQHHKKSLIENEKEIEKLKTLIYPKKKAWIEPLVEKLKPTKGLYTVFLERLKNLKRRKESGIIDFPLVFTDLCSYFHLKKQDCWEILFMLRDVGFIEIVPPRGIKIIKR